MSKLHDDFDFLRTTIYRTLEDCGKFSTDPQGDTDVRERIRIELEGRIRSALSYLWHQQKDEGTHAVLSVGGEDRQGISLPGGTLIFQLPEAEKNWWPVEVRWVEGGDRFSESRFEAVVYAQGIRISLDIPSDLYYEGPVFTEDVAKILYDEYMSYRTARGDVCCTPPWRRLATGEREPWISMASKAIDYIRTTDSDD